MKILLITCTILAFTTAVVYFLTGAAVLQPGDLQPDDAPAFMAYAAGACYLGGGLLLLLRRRRLWITGAILNAGVIALFFAFYGQRPDVLLSVPGLATKIAQLLLEAGLLYLILKSRRNS